MQNIPVGISNFETIRNNNYYYVDKTEMIHELLNGNQNAVTLITRPRRFGKTLAMSMLSSFFDIRKESKHLFEGLKIERDKDLCKEWMNQYPTIFLSFKDVDGSDFLGARESLRCLIADLYNEYKYVVDETVNENDKDMFYALSNVMRENPSDAVLGRSLALLTKLLCNYYHKPVILLLDEYDVPLAKASTKGYYNQMLNLIRMMMSTSFKDNVFLKFAVITGCLQISKESIFTGTNNFMIDNIFQSHLDEYFGFTDAEVSQLLNDSNLTDDFEIIKEWYDGYHFGNKDIYCPWDVLNYVFDAKKSNSMHKPISYWKNTSDNAIIHSFIQSKSEIIRVKLEKLLDGGIIIQSIESNLTYNFETSSENNFWSILYLTGYLTKCKDEELSKEEQNQMISSNGIALKIPNAEIKEIYQNTIIKWFNESVTNWNLKKLYEAVWNKDVEVITEELNRVLLKTISYQDYKEDFYHAFLAGIFTGAEYNVESNREHGLGRSDIVITNPETYDVVVFEVKHVKHYSKLEQECDKAIEQIQNRKYSEDFRLSHKNIFEYGICFYKKTCIVKCVSKKGNQ